MPAVPAVARSETGMVACICVEVVVPTVNFVVVAPAVQFTWEACVGSEFDRKLVPVSVMLCGVVAPATIAFGLIPVSVGMGFAGGLTINATGLERPLRPAPYAGLRVMMVATPDLATNEAGTFAVAMVPSMFPAVS